MRDKDCLFCQIIAGEAESVKVWENEDFLAIENKYPKAPVHVLVMPKSHIRKQEVATSENEGFWGTMMEAVFSVVHQLNFDQDRFKLVLNGGGYAHFEHEHIHVLGGVWLSLEVRPRKICV